MQAHFHDERSNLMIPVSSPPCDPLASHSSPPSWRSRIQSGILDFSNIFKAFMGTNFLSMAFAFSQSGLVNGIIGVIVIAIVTCHCCQLIVDCKRHVVQEILSKKTISLEIKSQESKMLLLEKKSEDLEREMEIIEENLQYADIGKHIWGWKGECMVNIFLAMTQFGFCVGYFIFMGNTLSALLPLSRAFCVLLPLPPLLLLAQLPNVRRIGTVSIFASNAIFIAFICVFVYEAETFDQRPSSPPPLFLFPSLPIFFGICVASFEGIGTIIPIESSMAGNREIFPALLVGALSLTTVILGSFGAIGFLRFGDAVSQIIIASLPASGLVVTLVRWTLVFAVLCTYPLQVSLTCVIAYFAFDSFSYISSFVGSVGSTMLAFVIPCVAHQKLFQTSRLVLVKDCAIIVFGLLGGIAGFVQTLHSLIDR